LSRAASCGAVAVATALVLGLGAAHGQTPTETAHVARWAYVLRDATARDVPRATGRPVTVVRSATPEGESNLVAVRNVRRDARGEDWVLAELAILPHASRGWLPRSALGELKGVRTRLVIDRKRLLAVLWRDGRVVFRAPIGIGQSRWPTPRGRFYVREKLAGFDDPFYGPVAFGTSARSRVLTDWPGGGYIGIHGTNRPELIPGRVSHGCVRLRNRDILRLRRLLPVGTPVTIL
jgi:lipoprotein-anchoring transpeptidase ErfK/SrfK